MLYSIVVSLHENLQSCPPQLPLHLFLCQPVVIHQQPYSPSNQSSFKRPTTRRSSQSGNCFMDVNHEQSVTFLRERFGQPYKLINVHMQSLLKLVNVINTLSTLQSIYNTREGHVRRLTSLGKHPESCGIMLTPVILSKLPKEVCKNIVREYNNVEWPLDDVCRRIVTSEWFTNLSTATRSLS